MKIFPNKADFIAFETGYTGKVLEEDIEKLEEDDKIKYFGNILDLFWIKDWQPEYMPDSNKQVL